MQLISRLNKTNKSIIYYLTSYVVESYAGKYQLRNFKYRIGFFFNATS